jgi:hypothetical protein
MDSRLGMGNLNMDNLDMDNLDIRRRTRHFLKIRARPRVVFSESCSARALTLSHNTVDTLHSSNTMEDLLKASTAAIRHNKDIIKVILHNNNMVPPRNLAWVPEPLQRWVLVVVFLEEFFLERHLREVMAVTVATTAEMTVVTVVTFEEGTSNSTLQGLLASKTKIASCEMTGLTGSDAVPFSLSKPCLGPT